jgi:hypothetical protein
MDSTYARPARCHVSTSRGTRGGGLSKEDWRAGKQSCSIVQRDHTRVPELGGGPLALQTDLYVAAICGPVRCQHQHNKANSENGEKSLRTDRAGSQVMDGMPPKSDHQPRQFTGGRFQSGQSRIRDTKDRWNQKGGKAGSGISG